MSTRTRRPLLAALLGAAVVLAGVVVAPAPAGALPGVGPWASVTTPSGDWNAVAYGGGVFVAVGNGAVMTSPDGVTWTARTPAAADNWLSVAYGDGLFVAVASQAAMTSPDGVTWTSRTVSQNFFGPSVTFSAAEHLFVAVAADIGTTLFGFSSPDGITWTPFEIPGRVWSSVTYGDGMFVAVASDGSTRVMTSPDSVNWTQRAAAELNAWQSVTYSAADDLFVAVASDGTNRVMTSPDGATWTSRAAAEANSWRSVTYDAADDLFVAVASDGTNRVMTSPDGVTWTGRDAPVSDWREVTSGDGRVVGVGNGSAAMVSYTPTVTSVSPTTGSTAGGTTMTITGTNLLQATGVTVGGVAATGVTVNSATSVTATVPAHAAGAVDVVVTTSGGDATRAGGFTYTDPTPAAPSATPTPTSTPSPSASPTATPSASPSPSPTASAPPTVFVPPPGRTNPTTPIVLADGIAIASQQQANHAPDRDVLDVPARTLRTAPLIRTPRGRVFQLRVVDGLPARTTVTSFLVADGTRLPLAEQTTTRTGSLVLPALWLRDPGRYNLGLSLSDGTTRWIRLLIT